MGISIAVKLTLAGAVATAMLAINLGACSENGQAALSCRLGGACSPSEVCTTGIEGCASNCQCVSGTWQSPCPAETPQSGSSCNAEGATCGYLTNQTNANTCGNGTVDCSCRGGAWACEPSCNTPPDAGADAAGCIGAGGECLFSNVICAKPGPQSCRSVAGTGSYCCISNVANCGQPSATTYACPPALDGGLTCPSAPVPLGAPNYEALVQANDGDASYPVGCRATFPACNNGHVPFCVCKLDETMVPEWTCFF